MKDDDSQQPAFAAVDMLRLPADGRVVRHVLADDDAGWRSQPWHDDEYLHAGPLRLVYTVVPSGELVVHLPGGGRCDVQGLRSLGFEVKLPRTVRDDRRRLKRSQRRAPEGGRGGGRKS